MRVRWNRRIAADMKRKHRKWPLGTPVWVKTPQGYLPGRVHKHWMKGERGDVASIDFGGVLVDMGNANGTRLSHDIPVRSLKRALVGEQHG
ncbi:hypothetical protein R70006_06227 [Paraburkholderia domus]|uniref:hypothetical protein n=1 Tax=Paraburkholderia domus TaxID=2793075 RepID=UPI001913C885|nr:hypothetical protein [Paraburkholderia domus]MBK5052858.1 hypothetical protein [Burkholderia sp. R-70006]CAE6821604.1 hypothetical protein R70006_06227 [Paraburkholderia domus]